MEETLWVDMYNDANFREGSLAQPKMVIPYDREILLIFISLQNLATFAGFTSSKWPRFYNILKALNSQDSDLVSS